TEKGNYYLNLAREQIARLSFVATQLLDFQKVDAGKGQIFLVMVDIVQLVRNRVSMFEASARNKQLHFSFESSESSYTTAVDELKIEKVVDNLLSNAIKYSFTNNQIDVKLTLSEKEWELEVKDYGVEISDLDQSKLFKEFYRADNAINSKIVGSGIGLLLVKNYVSMHNGKVELISDKNTGTIFKIIIPHGVVSEVKVIDPKVIECESVNSEIAENTDDVATADKKIQVLIVEDNNDLQNFLKYAFESKYKVSVASNGKEAWDSIQKKLPDLVISDIMMPEMDGFTLCKLIKSTFDTSHIPVILLTALSDQTNQLEGLKLGADDYLTKPFDVTLLKQRINNIISNREVVRSKMMKMIRQTDTNEPILTNEYNDQFVKKALAVVRENIANCDFGKDEFASALNSSPSLLYKKIKTLTGQSPVDFIKFIRLDYSVELLKTRRFTITEVSEQCGFSSVGYFSTVFKKHYGKSPTDTLE
ncbi:MAG TPA: response regulator, partial [Paludibacter sp.]